MFSLEGREAEIIAVVLLTLLSAIKLTDDRVRGGGGAENTSQYFLTYDEFLFLPRVLDLPSAGVPSEVSPCHGGVKLRAQGVRLWVSTAVGFQRNEQFQLPVPGRLDASAVSNPACRASVLGHNEITQKLIGRFRSRVWP